jgi:hypothetical protein
MVLKYDTKNCVEITQLVLINYLSKLNKLAQRLENPLISKLKTHKM